MSVVSSKQTLRTMTQKRYCPVKAKRVLVKQRKKLSLFEIVEQLFEYTSSSQLSTYDEEKILLSSSRSLRKHTR